MAGYDSDSSDESRTRFSEQRICQKNSGVGLDMPTVNHMNSFTKALTWPTPYSEVKYTNVTVKAMIVPTALPI